MKRPPDRKLLLAAALVVAAGAALSRPAVELNQPETVMVIFSRLLGPGGS